MIISQETIQQSALFLPQKNNLLKINNLHTYFQTYHGLARALRGVSFSVPKGEILGLVGETGSGKSVTVLSTLGLVKPPGRVHQGEALYGEGDNQIDLLKLSRRQMTKIRGKRISIIFQNPRASLNPLFTIEDQFGLVVRQHLAMKNNQEVKEFTLSWLRKVGLTDPERRITQYPHELSTGMCQRVLIAIALMCEPELLITDEPTTGIDVTLQAQILELIKELVERMKTSVIMITHDIGVVSQTTDWVAVMYMGKIVEFGPTIEVLVNPRHPYTYGLLKSTLRVDKDSLEIYSIPGDVPNIFRLPNGCTFHPRCKWATDECSSVEPEETMITDEYCVFCHHTERLALQDQ